MVNCLIVSAASYEFRIPSTGFKAMLELACKRRSQKRLGTHLGDGVFGTESGFAFSRYLEMVEASGGTGRRGKDAWKRSMSPTEESST